MKKFSKVIALAVGCTLTLSIFAACGSGGDAGNNNGNNGGTDDESEAVSTRLCYDNLPNDGITLAEEDTSIEVKGATNIKAYRFEGGTALTDYTTVATYENGVFTAQSLGIITYEAKGKQGRIEVLPAYVTDPGNQYTGRKDYDTTEVNGAKYLGHTHDPSFIEVMENGKPVYYLFSTGWNDISGTGNNRTYGNAIHKSEDLITWSFIGRTFKYSDRDAEFINTKAGDWLYGGSLGSGYTSASASWWAPDIVPDPNGGYWLYTCVVDGAGDSSGMRIGNFFYARACILLYHSDYLYSGMFTPVLDDNGDPVVLMQSSIQRGESVADVNGIDPQIIYSPEGKMYMAYGSFGSGNYMIELDPATGLRKDGKGWQTHDEIRSYVEAIQPDYGSASSDSIGWTHDYYGKNISKANMEAPVFARHDNVQVFDETATFDASGNPVGVNGKTYYYTMHSFDGLGDNYQMWGGRSEDVWGVYRSTGGGIVRNVNPGNSKNSGNKYMGAFAWSNKSAGNKEIDIILPGHNDLFTTGAGLHLAAYITRTKSYNSSGSGDFLSQVHQYYLNSQGDIVINPNRYSGEIDRAVTADELFTYTENGKFKMVSMKNQRDTGSEFSEINYSVDVTLTRADGASNGEINTAAGEKIGTWIMYGRGYIKFTFDSVQSNGEQVYYGIVRPAWLGDQNKSGFTITCMGHTNADRSMAMFMNNYSTLSGEGLVG